MGYKNCEGYSDPTAGAAISATTKEEQEVEKLNHKVIQSFRLLVDLPCAVLTIIVRRSKASMTNIFIIGLGGLHQANQKDTKAAANEEADTTNYTYISTHN